MPRFIRHISVRFALLLALAAVVPLVAYGAVSILSLQRGTRQEVVQGNENVANRAAEEIRRYVSTNAELLKALAANLQDAGLTLEQQDRVLKNSVHGEPDKKALVAQARNMSAHPLVAALRAVNNSRPVSSEYVDANGEKQLGVATMMAPLGWAMIVEQPTREAYANASVLQQQLVV